MIKSRLTSAFFLAAIFSISVSLPVHSGPPDTARELEKKGEREGAVRQYEAWLEANRESTEFISVLFHTADIHPDIRKAVILLDKYAPSISDRGDKTRLLAKTAAFHEILGDYTTAQRLFEESYYNHPDESTFTFLLRSARLLYERGEAAKSEDQARVVGNLSRDPGIKKQAVFLLARIIAGAGNLEEGLRVSLLLTEDPSNTADNESILLFAYNIALQIGREQEKKRALERLSRDYPETPEFRLAEQMQGKAGGGVGPFPSPSSLLNPIGLPESVAPVPRDPAPAARPSATRTPAPPATAVQTGSFSVRENAEYMVRDLRGLGFPAEIREDVNRDGGKIFKVIIPVNGKQSSSEETQRLLILLKEKGVEGFLLF